MIKLTESNIPYVDREIETIPFKMCFSKNGGCNFFYNPNNERGFLCFDDYCVLIYVSKSKADNFIQVYYNSQIPDPYEYYGINDPNEEDYYKVYVDEGIIDNFLILKANEVPSDVIYALLLDWDPQVG